MYHSITFTDESGVSKNTWDDFHLIPKERPVFEAPEVKTKYIDIPGGNGSLDLTEALTGYPIYKPRSGEFTFTIVHQGLSVDGIDGSGYNNLANISFRDTCREMLSYFHGRRFKAILEDDPAWYYEGRFVVDSFDQGEHNTELKLKYEVEPFKFSIFDSLSGDWLWDPFNFITDDVPASLGDMPVTTQWVTHSVGSVGAMPIVPTIIISNKSATYGGLEIIYKTTKNPSGVTQTIPMSTNRMTLSSRYIMHNRDGAGSSRTYSFRTTAGTCHVGILFRRGEL